MRRTLLLTHEYYPFAGGIANYCYQLFKNFEPADYLIVTDQKEVSQLPNLLQTRLIGKFFRPRWLTGLFKLKRIIKEHDIKVIFTPHIFPLGQVANRLKQQLGTPYIISLHGLDINLALKKDRRQALRILEMAEHIIVNSQAVKRIIEPFNLKTPVTVLTPAFEPAKEFNRDQALIDRLQSQPTVITVGRLVRRKNHQAILTALAELPELNYQYLIIGQGPERTNLEKQINDLAISQKVRILANVSHKELPNYYLGAKLFVMPVQNQGSDIEGFGIVYLEAGYYGLPVIASRGTSAGEIITDGLNGLLIDPNQKGELAAAIKQVLTDQEPAAQLGQAAKKRIADFPSTAQQSEKLKQILSGPSNN